MKMHRSLNFKKYCLLSLVIILSSTSIYAHTGHPEIKPEDIPRLSKSLKEGNEAERQKAAFELGYLLPPDEKAIAPLVAALSDTNPKVQLEAVISLGILSSVAKDALPHLRQGLSNQNVEIRCASSWAISEFQQHGTDVSNFLIPLIEDQDLNCRFYALSVVAKDDKSPKQAEAIVALGLMINEPIMLYGHERGKITQAVVASVFQSLNPTIAPRVLRESKKYQDLRITFLTALKSEHYMAREAGARGIGWLASADKETIDTLREFLRSKSSDPIDVGAVYMVLKALGTMGPVAKDAVPEISQKLDFPDPLVAQASRIALKKIQGKP